MMTRGALIATDNDPVLIRTDKLAIAKKPKISVKNRGAAFNK